MKILRDACQKNGFTSLFCAMGSYQCDFLLVGEIPTDLTRLVTLTSNNSNNRPDRPLGYIKYQAERVVYKTNLVPHRRHQKESATIDANFYATPNDRLEAVVPLDAVVVPLNIAEHIYAGVFFEPTGRQKPAEIRELAKSEPAKLGWELWDVYHLFSREEITEDWLIDEPLHKNPYFLVYRRPVDGVPTADLFDAVHRLHDSLRYQVPRDNDVLSLPLSPKLLSLEFYPQDALQRQAHARAVELVTRVVEQIAPQPDPGADQTRSTVPTLWPTFEHDANPAPSVSLPLDKHIALFARSRSGKMPLTAKIAGGFLAQDKRSFASPDHSRYRVLFVNFKAFDFINPSDIDRTDKDSTKVVEYPHPKASPDYHSVCKSFNVIAMKLMPSDIVGNSSNITGIGDVIYTEVYIPKLPTKNASKGKRDKSPRSAPLPSWLDFNAIVEGAKRLDGDQTRGIIVIIDEFKKLMEEAVDENKSMGLSYTLKDFAFGVLKFLDQCRTVKLGEGIRVLCILQELSDFDTVAKNCRAVSVGFDLRKYITSNTLIIGPQEDKEGSGKVYESLVEGHLVDHREVMEELKVDTLVESNRRDPGNATDFTAIGAIIVVPNGMGPNAYPIPCHIPPVEKKGGKSQIMWDTLT